MKQPMEMGAARPNWLNRLMPWRQHRITLMNLISGNTTSIISYEKATEQVGQTFDTNHFSQELSYIRQSFVDIRAIEDEE